MRTRISPTAYFALSAGLIGMLSGCAATPMGPTVQVMPGHGKTFDAFQVDNTSCKSFAAGQVQGQADAANQRAAGAAVLTTLLGAGLGAAVGGATGDAGAGAAIGAAAGAGTGGAIAANGSSYDQMNIQQQYDNAFSQCMYAKGEMVPGFTPAVATVYVPTAVTVADPLVRSTQAELARLGYYRGVADGVAGPRTYSAISSFEQANGLPVDGSPSARLLARLQSTPSGSSMTAGAPAAPGGWVSPNGSSSASPVNASAPAGSNWVAPTKTP